MDARPFGPRLTEGLSVQEQFWRASVMIGSRDEPKKFFGSGFFVADVDWGLPCVDNDSATLFLVTAAHVLVEGSVLYPGGLRVRAPRYMGDEIDIEIPAREEWILADDESDVAIVAMPNLKHSRHVGGLALAAVAPTQMFVAGWFPYADQYRLGDISHFIGLWQGRTGMPQLIMRTGFIANATRSPVQTPMGRSQVYLFDAVVTPGMSGGLVYATRGSGLAENVVLGVTQGYWPTAIDDRLANPEKPETPEERWRRNLSARLDEINSGISMVTPIHHVAELLQRHPLWARRPSTP